MANTSFVSWFIIQSLLIALLLYSIWLSKWFGLIELFGFIQLLAFPLEPKLVLSSPNNLLTGKGYLHA